MSATQKFNEIGSAWLGALNWEEASLALAQLPVIIPVGGAAIDHGRYLPYDTDAVIATALVAAVAARWPVLVAPTIDVVYAPARAGRGITISLDAESFIDLVSDVIRSLARHNARHIVIVARGQSTLAPLQIVSREMHEEFGITVTIANDSGLAHDLRSTLNIPPDISHTRHVATSIMLALAPDRVGIAPESISTDDRESSSATLHEPIFITPYANQRSIDDDGVSTGANAVIGQQLLDTSVAEIVEHLNAATAGWDNRATPPSLDGTNDSTWTASSLRIGQPDVGYRVRDLTADSWPTVAKRCEVAVLPMGAASKEHGYHLPNQTDYLTANALGNAAVLRLPVLLLPVFGYGYYPAFVDWPGSMSLSPTTYRRVVANIVECLAAAGIRKILLLDTGLSTRPVLEIVATDAFHNLGVSVALATTELGRAAALELFDGEGTHANEDETALMLAVAPEQVDLSRAVPELRPSTVISRRDPFAPPAFIQGGKMRSPSGVFGDPTKATAESGARYLQANVSDLIEFLESFIALEM